MYIATFIESFEIVTSEMEFPKRFGAPAPSNTIEDSVQDWKERRYPMPGHGFARYMCWQLESLTAIYWFSAMSTERKGYESREYLQYFLPGPM